MSLAQAVRLPPNFAQKVIQLESLLDDSLSMDLIQDLNELYRIGIDYYIQCQPRKAQHFQKKMTKLLADPATLTLIELKSPSKPHPSAEIRSPRLATRSKISNEISRFNNCSNEYVRNIIEQSEKVSTKTGKLLDKDLNKQEQELQNRIQLKKYKSQEKLLKLKDIIG